VRVLQAATLFVAVAVGGSASALAETSVDPTALIRAMSKALSTLNYEGVFVHSQQGILESMHILHANSNGNEHERMLSLNGEAREIIRNNSLVTCIWPNSQSVIVSKSKKREILPQVEDLLASSALYDLSLEVPDRVAGINTHVVSIKPRDSYRYGYTFWIDKKTNMLLRSRLLNTDDNPIEEIMFTEISYPDTVLLSRFDTDAGDSKNVSWVDPKPRSLSGEQSNRVSFVSLPEGYSKVSESFRPLPSNDTPVSHVMLTDGMVSVSVYVEYLSVNEQDVASRGLSSMGALNAYGRSMPNAFVTVVGEVPGETVMAIADAVTIDR